MFILFVVGVAVLSYFIYLDHKCTMKEKEREAAHFYFLRHQNKREIEKHRQMEKTKQARRDKLKRMRDRNQI